MASKNAGNKQARRSAFFVLWVNVAIMATVAIGMLVGVWFWLASYTLHGEGIDVPDVKGKMVSDATYELGLMELDAVVVDSGYNETLPPGVILAQVPDYGCRVKSGREIFLTVNAEHSPTMPIPDIADNCSRREAEAKLAALGFKRVVVQKVPGDIDWVIAVKCDGVTASPGERAPLDAVITIEVGNGSMSAIEESDSLTSFSDGELNDLF